MSSTAGRVANPASGAPSPVIWLAANNGDIGGGEVMLLRTAEAVRSLGIAVGIVAPRQPSGVAEAAGRAGFTVAVLPAEDRRSWMVALRRWDRNRSGLLWCHGLVPAAATAGRPRRIVHLHQAPIGAVQRILSRAARWRARAVVVPSVWMTTAVRAAEVLPNWTDQIPVSTRIPGADGPLRIGFLGRVSEAKGILVLLAATTELERRRPGGFRLVVAGEARFVPASGRDVVDVALDRAGGLVDRLGWVDRDTFLSAIDILVVPSIAPESFGLSAAEAMAARVPVVVTDSGALPEVVGPPVSLVPPAEDPAALAEVLAAMADGTVDPLVEERYERWHHHYSPGAGRARVADFLARMGIPVSP